jgi:two-component system phosphate regulon response regulator PhoB
MAQHPIPPRIAVIDDDAVFLDLMQDLLGVGEGYDVVTSSDWLDSFGFLKQTQPDLVILDLMMGREQTGWAILELLHEDATTRDIPVIVCSAAAPALDQHADRLRHRMVSAMAKPFDVDVLLVEIERMLASRRTPA